MRRTVFLNLLKISTTIDQKHRTHKPLGKYRRKTVLSKLEKEVVQEVDFHVHGLFLFHWAYDAKYKKTWNLIPPFCHFPTRSKNIERRSKDDMLLEAFGFTINVCPENLPTFIFFCFLCLKSVCLQNANGRICITLLVEFCPASGLLRAMRAHTRIWQLVWSFLRCFHRLEYHHVIAEVKHQCRGWEGELRHCPRDFFTLRYIF